MNRKIYKISYLIFCFSVLMITWSSCKKVVEIDPPAASVTTSEVFKDSTNTSAAILNLYSKMINTSGQLYYFDGALSVFCGLSADELVSLGVDGNITPLYTDALLSNSTFAESSFFSPAYQEIYRANACIEGINASTGISAASKNQFLGEAKFIRALAYFYLINIFGDVPYITSTNWQESSLASRTPKEQIYQAIISDLKDAQSLPNDYSISGGERIRVNYWAVTALLAKVYLYHQADYKDAYESANTVISNTGLFTLNPDVNSVFLKNNSEAIFQLEMNNYYNPPKNATAEGYVLIPSRPGSFARYYLSTQLLNAFESGDKRRSAWIDSTNFAGMNLLYPYKYKIGSFNASTSSNEYYMVLRLAEQYLIRAEAEANGVGNGIGAAITDLNAIRNRAGLPNYSGATDKTSVMSAIMHERQIELFAEWGNRWMDLKRTGQIDAVMTQVVPTKIGGTVWNSYQQLYPIPQAEILRDPNLKQNPGY